MMNEWWAQIKSVVGPAEQIAYMPLESLCEVFQRPMYEVITIFSALIAFLVCLPMPWFRNTTFRKAYSLFWGVTIGFYTYGIPFFMYIAFVILGYLQLRFLPTRVSTSTIPVIAMGILILRAGYQTLKGSNAELSVKTVMMVAYIKMCYIALNRKDADAIARNDARHLTKREEIYAEPLKEIPTFIEWCEYFFFCGVAVIGPATEYKDFVDYINLRGAFG